MKIKNIKIQNFRKLENFESDFKDANLFTGENGVGKTTIINAISWLLTGKSFLGKSIEVKPMVKGVVNKDVVTEVKATVVKDDVELELIRKFNENNSTQIMVRNIKTGAIETMKVGDYEKFVIEELGFDPILYNPSILFDGRWNDIRTWIIDKFELTPVPNAPYLPKFETFELENSYDAKTIKKVVNSLEEEFKTMTYALEQIEALVELVEMLPQEVIQSLEDFKRAIKEKEDELTEAKSVQKVVNANVKMYENANAEAFEKANELLKEIDPNLKVDAKKKKIIYKDIPYGDLSTGEKMRFSVALSNIFHDKGYHVPLALDELGTLTGEVEVKNQLFGTDAVDGLQLTVEIYDLE